MNEKINYQLVLDKKLEFITKENIKPKLLLHICCAPCSSYVLEYLNSYFDITVFFYNPNISPKEEYDYRANELKRLIKEMGLNDIKIIVLKYDNAEFYDVIKGLEQEPEGGRRCTECFKLRLNKSAKYACDNNFDYYTTTLSISPHKDAQRLNSIGKEYADTYGIKYLFSDFKKKEGYKRSCELSVKYNLYRQDYCGCIYSKTESENRK